LFLLILSQREKAITVTLFDVEDEIRGTITRDV
jgi:hypothetical protein